ncbi:signal peptidase II [Tissierella pigra]|uniref:Signal peptidase II n=1 Tax=Tissierella pigra TaxID=2607614 RepID=A0A6N7XWE6_9FIRM|nr:signal peptidase II [Tissierella pigra]MBU5425573.1 signal peptidase II [Tissierella pigra]MSU00874.1 signal peptidase II [Tissierella pigra]
MKKIIKSKNEFTKIMILSLIILEQGIKIIVKAYYGVKAPIIENILYFAPVLNDNYSYINSLFNLGWGRIFHILLVIFVLFFSYYAFKYLEAKGTKNSMINTMKIFLFAGTICSLIDKVFWNGSLDYILLKGFFVFDLKDCYLTIFEVLVIILIVKDRKKASKINDKELLKDYIKFIKNDFLTRGE